MKKLNIPTLNFINSTILSIILMFVFGVLWYNSRQNDLEKNFERNKLKLLNSSKDSLRDMVNSAVRLINDSHKSINKRIQNELQNRVLELESLGNNLSTALSIPESSQEFKNIFWSSIATVGREDQAFTFLISPTTADLIIPDDIRETTADLETPAKYNIMEIIEQTKIHPEGFFSDSLMVSDTKEPPFISKKCFAKYSPSLKMIVGYCFSSSAIEEASKQEVFDIVGNMGFKDDDYIFILKDNGVMLAHDDPLRINQNLIDFTDKNGVKVIRDLINTAKDNPEGGFVRYVWRRPSTEEIANKISFAKEIKSLEWVVGSGLYLVNFEAILAEQHADLEQSLNENLKTLFYILFLMIFLIIIISSYISYKIKAYSSLFTTALQNSVTNRCIIDIGVMKLPELEQVSTSTNKMLDELLTAEEQLKQLTNHLEDKVAQRTQELLTKTKQLEESTQLANAANIAKSNFLANMSHEIRTPMNIILGMQQLILDSNITHTQHNYLIKANEAAASLLGIIDDILDFSKIEAGKLNIENIEFDLEYTLSNILTFLSFEANKKNLDLILDYDTNIPNCLLGDPLRLRQIISNICSNAIKFTSEGSIHILIKLLESPAGKNNINFTIIDSGIGISSEKQRELFSPFKQADTSTTREFGGTGLGLIICKQLIELQGGNISLQSTPNKGTTISFTIPFCRVSGSKSSRYRISPKHKGERVLIIDINRENLNILKRYSDEAGFETDVTTSLAGANSLFNKKSSLNPIYHSILINTVIADTYGLEAFLYLKGHFPVAATNFILITKETTPEIVKSSKEQGFDVTLNKPITPSQLIRTLENPKDTAITTSKILYAKNLQNAAFNNLSILVVEDNITNQEIIEALLSKIGCTVVLANNGQEGIFAAKRNKFDIIFMDVQMPVLDGLSATEEIRKFDRNTPIIAMTAHAMSEDYHKSIAAGMNEHITKPIKIDKLYEALYKYGVKNKTETMILNKAEASEPASNTAAPEEKGISRKKSIDNDPVLCLIWHKLENLSQLNIRQALENTGDDQRLLTKIYKEYIKIGTEVLNSLNTAYEKRDMEAIWHVAHTLKGSGGAIGAIKIAKTATELESKLRINIKDEVSSEVDDLITELSSLISALRSIFSEDATS